MPTITRCWTRVGQQRVVLTPGVRAKKRWDWAAVDTTSGQVVHVLHVRRNNVGFRRLLAAIARAYQLQNHPQRRVILFVDNDMAHRAKPVSQLLEKHDHRIQVEWLPAYAPELNPQEDVWRHLRRRVTDNHYFHSIAALLAAVQEFHHDLADHPATVQALIKPWFHRIQPEKPTPVTSS